MGIEKSENGMVLVDRDFHIVSFNSAFKKYYPQAELGKICYKAFHNFKAPCAGCRIVSGIYDDSILLNPNFGTWVRSGIEPVEVQGVGKCFSISVGRNSEEKEVIKADFNVISSNQHLLENHELWNTAMNNMPNGYNRCSVDNGLTFLNVSNRFCEIIGYSWDEIRDLFDNKYINLIYDDDIPKIRSSMDRDKLNENNSYVQLVYRMKSKNGIIWVIDSTKYVKTKNEVFYQGTITDVTNIVGVHLKDRESLLLTENKINQYKKALISGANVIYEVNVSRDILEVANFYNGDDEYGIGAICDMEVPCSYMKFLPIIANHISEDDKNIFFETNTIDYFKRCFTSGVLKWQLEYDTLSVLKKHVHLRKHYILTQNEHTGDIHALIVAKDLTEEELAKKESEYKLKVQKKELASALYDAEQRLKVIEGLCNEYHIVLYVDVQKDMCIPYVAPDSNNWRYKIGEYQDIPFSKIVSKYIKRNVVREERDELFAKTAMDVVLRELKEKDTYQVNYKIKKGLNFEHAQVRIVSIDNNKYEQVWAFRSIEHIVQEESKQQKILQDLLVKAQKAEKAKTIFLLNMSHDIRTPMNAIIGFNTIARDNIDNREEALDALTKTNIASHHLLNLINEVLEMARIESNKVEIHNQLVCIKDFFIQEKEMFSSEMKEKGIKFISDYNGVTPFVYFDSTRVMQVVTNLLGNAMKFTKPGGKIFYTLNELETSSDDVITFEFSVKDTGIGMSTEFQKKLFDAFEREENPTTSVVSGTGLGLAISKNIANMLGGTLTCKSHQGKGSEFFFSFKAKVANNQEEIKNYNLKKSQDQFEQLNMGDRRLLIVEDNELNLEIALKIISRYGISVEAARDGAMAVEMVKKSAPGYYDLILMDIQMPKMDGYTATTKIRHLKNKELAGIPIVAMTANAFEEDKKKAMAVGMNGHLSKPINIPKLLEIIQKLMIFK